MRPPIRRRELFTLLHPLPHGLDQVLGRVEDGLDPFGIERRELVEDAQTRTRPQAGAPRPHIGDRVARHAEKVGQLGIGPESAGILHQIEQFALDVERAFQALSRPGLTLRERLTGLADAFTQSLPSARAMPAPRLCRLASRLVSLSL